MKKLTQAGICFLAGWIGVLSAQEKVPADWKLTSLDQIQAKWSSASLGELRAAAEKGDATAQCFLGITLGGMEGHAEDTESHQETIKLLQRAADAGLAAAQVQLAWLYYEGTIDMDVVFGRPDDMH
ncbi:MAG: hypothetical protein JWM68_3263, partial [Verrucomicrobiales bacterium]|nr:hypothetical protein [Verrucomicrobiales bacterium]